MSDANQPPPPDEPAAPASESSGPAQPTSLPPSGLPWVGWLRDFWLVLGFFTRLPVVSVTGHLGDAARAFPLAGLVVGLIGALV